MKFNSILPLAAICLCFGLLAPGKVSAKPAKFSFTQIANTNSDANNFGTPVINNAGTVAFTDNQGVFKSNGTTTTTVIDYKNSIIGGCCFGDDISINDAGTVAFTGTVNQEQGTATAILTGNGTVTPMIVATIFNISSADVSDLSINNHGNIAYTESVFPTPSGFSSILTSDGRTIDTIGRLEGSVNLPAINNNGVVAYRRELRSFFGQVGQVEILVNDGINTTTIASVNSNESVSANVDLPAINNAGTVAYRSETRNPQNTFEVLSSQIFKSNGTKTTPIADSRGLFSRFDNLSINDQGKVAFLAELDAGGEAIYTQTDRKRDKIIATGESLFGYTVVDLTFSGEGLNNSGQVTFIAQLANNTKVVVRAEPRRKPN